MTDKAALLATLIDVQEPTAPEQAVPWLLMANGLLLVAIPIIIAVRAYRHRNRWRREALHALADIESSPSNKLAGLAALLRRIARHRLGHHASHQDGDPWLNTLDECFDTKWFSAAEGQVFGAQLYQPQDKSATHIKSLCKHIRKLIKRLPAKAHKVSAGNAVQQTGLGAARHE